MARDVIREAAAELAADLVDTPFGPARRSELAGREVQAAAREYRRATAIDLARQCRAAQRAYFRSRSVGDLDTARSLERRLDEALAAIDHPPAPALPGMA